jgi:hypothetical protein
MRRYPISLKPNFDDAYLRYLSDIASADVTLLLEKEKTYKGSWKKRGGVGAFMMLARKWDRLENMLEGSKPAYDLFAEIEANPTGEDGSILAEVRDLRRYLLLVEAEMTARGTLELNLLDNSDELFKPGTPDDGGHHDLGVEPDKLWPYEEKE